MNIGENIKLFRKKSKLTQKQLAELIGVSTISIQNYENNRRTPDIYTLEKISKELNYPLSTLLSKSVSSYDELIKDLLDYIINKYEVGKIQLKYPDMSEYVITLPEAFLDFFGIFFPEENKFTENLISDMLVIFIYKDFDFIIGLLDMHSTLIHNFSQKNLLKINKALGEYNLSLDFLNTTSDETCYPEIFSSGNNTKYINYSTNELKNTSYIDVKKNFQSVLDYIKINSNHKSLKLLRHDPEEEKLLFQEMSKFLEQQLLMILINKGILVDRNELDTKTSNLDDDIPF